MLIICPLVARWRGDQCLRATLAHKDLSLFDWSEALFAPNPKQKRASHAAAAAPASQAACDKHIRWGLDWKEAGWGQQTG